MPAPRLCRVEWRGRGGEGGAAGVGKRVWTKPVSPAGGRGEGGASHRPRRWANPTPRRS
ncbi:hypothetical protein E2C01_064030 [Portunus trituberculatus]|uniref:Uncharacterized protein n=1 Tax=Portunus trituberculatus TaxID=210409 RepID=A0A5B7HJ91_PORTR|nr:hypothetical protein [Portunus trituberculatus]